MDHNELTTVDLAEANLKGWNEAKEAAASLAERDVDWTKFGKPLTHPFEGGSDSVREYRLGIVTGQVIAMAIRRMDFPNK